jgi:hypothetical protein
MAFGVGHTLFGIRPDIAIRDEGAGSTQPGSSAKKTSRHIAARRGSLVEARNRMREATLCGPTSAMKKSCEDSVGDTEQRCNRRLAATVFRRILPLEDRTVHTLDTAAVSLSLNLYKYGLSTFYKY